MQRLFFVILLFCSFAAKADFLHLELGVANYGAEDGNAQTRFAVLDDVLKNLVKKYGKAGTIYLNDIDESGLNMAVKHVEFWFGERHYGPVKVIPLLGNYEDLKKVAIPKVKTANLNNPSGSQLPDPWVSGYRDDLQPHYEKQNRNCVDALERIAHQSETGLKITSYYYLPSYPALERLGELAIKSNWIDTGIEAHDYVGPNGRKYISTNEKPRIYLLIPKCLSDFSHQDFLMP